MRSNITLERDEDGVWISECPSILGCVSQGKTRLEAAENIKEAIALCVEVRTEERPPLSQYPTTCRIEHCVKIRRKQYVRKRGLIHGEAT
jgi:predicted RNase H-like HicB family nuclease